MDIFKKIKSNKFEISLLLIFFFSLIYFSSVFDNGKLDHNTPNQIHANDMFIFSAYADAAKYNDNLEKVPNYLSGNHNDSYNFFSPLSGILNAQISSFLDTESFNLVIHFNIIFILFSILSMYVILRKINTLASLLTLPMFFLLFSWPYTFIINWGGNIGNMNIFLVVISILAFIHIKEKGMFFILGILNAASFLSHGREFQSFNLGIVLFFLLYFFKEKVYFKIFNFKEYLSYFKTEDFFIRSKLFLYSVFISIIFIFPWWKAMFSFVESNSDKSEGLIVWNYNPLFHQVTFSDLYIFLYLALIGLLFWFIFFFKNKKNINMDIIGIISLFLILSGIIKFFGNNLPQARAFYLITFMPFIFLFFLVIITKLKENLKLIFTGFIFSLLILYVGLFSNFKEISQDSIIMPQVYEAQVWMSENLEEDQTLLILNCNSCSQKASFTPARIPYHLIQEKDYIDSLNSLTLKNTFLVDSFPIHHKFELSQDSWFINPGFIPQKVNKTLCEYRYIYFESQTRNPNFAKYSILIANKLINESNFDILYNNGLSVILENNNLNSSCFTQTSLNVEKRGTN